ncbi:MAG: hypothetical protein QG671_2356 [Actinomycetota bacterium]|jgi:hypothetical protein|nr:hypothetical protein [Actinomycetota bacterium]
MSEPNEQQPSTPDRIVISSADLTTPEVDERVQAMAQAQQVALVRDVGAPTTSTGGSGRAILTLTLGGAVGGLLAFALLRVLLDGLNLFSDNAFGNNLSFTFVLAVCIGAAVALAEAVTSRSWAKVGKVAAIALPAAVGAALVMGLIAHVVYSSGTDWAFNTAYDQYLQGNLTEQQVEDYITLRLHPIRGAAWMLVGISAGIAAGAASRSWKRLGLAVLGGAVGGFLGGFIFDFIPTGSTQAEADRAEFLAQLIGIVLLGTLIGLSTGIVEQAGKSRWIEIVSGGLAGKQFILYKPSITLGSSPGADITLIKDSLIPPVAAVMRVKGAACQLDAAEATYPIVVNGTRSPSSMLTDGDIVTFGGTQLRFREKSSQGKVPGALRS